MKHKPLIILSGLYCFHIISNYIWLKLDKSYLLFDDALYHINSLRLFEAIKNFPPALFSGEFFRIFHRSGFSVGLITAPFYFFFGFSQDAAVMVSNSIFLGVLLFFIYGIGKRLQGEKVGLLGAFIISMYPTVFNQSKTYMFDLPLSAFVSLNIYLVIRSDGFRNKIFTVLYILSVVLGLLIKFNFLAFVIGAMLLVLRKGIERANQKRLAVSLIIAASIVLLFGFNSLKMWVLHLLNILPFKHITYSSELTFIAKVVSLFATWFYAFLIFTKILITDSLSLFFVLIFAVGFFVLLKSKPKHTFFYYCPS